MHNYAEVAALHLPKIEAVSLTGTNRFQQHVITRFAIVSIVSVPRGDPIRTQRLPQSKVGMDTSSQE